MATVHTTIPAVKLALFNKLTADANIQSLGVQVAYSHPGEALTNQAVYLGNAQFDVHIPVFAGAARLRRQEEYLLEVFISVAQPTSDAQLADATAWSAYNSLDDILANDPTVGGLVIKAWPRHIEGKVGFDESRRGWGALIKVEVAVEARLT